MYCLHFRQIKINWSYTPWTCVYFQKSKHFSSGLPVSENHETKLKGTVFVSSDNNIYTNLALEDWFYRRWNFSTEHVLLLWRNEPCVVIGRHQNPWAECNTSYLANKNISLARRNSGGGTVYHDMGNLNCTFFTDRKCYGRKANLQLICRALQRDWNVNVAVSPREDITLDDSYKISGTAAKLARDTAYHHCTVLFNADKEALTQSLTKRVSGLESKATASVPSTVRNLQDVVSEIDYWPLIRSICREFFLTHEGSRKWNVIDPTEESFPGIDEIRKHLSSWEWIYGHTPRFTLKKHFPLPFSGLSTTSASTLSTDSAGQLEFYRELSTTGDQLTINLQVYHAKVENILITPNEFLLTNTMSEVVQRLTGKWFRSKDIEYEFVKMVNALTDVKQNDEEKRLMYISDCIQNMIMSM